MRDPQHSILAILREFFHRWRRTICALQRQGQIADYVLPSRKRFMQCFEARKADAAAEEMERHLKRVNRNYLVLVAERSKSNEIIAGQR